VACTKSSRQPTNCNDMEDRDLLLLLSVQPEIRARVRRILSLRRRMLTKIIAAFRRVGGFSVP
jgi:hypothetical protein